MKKFFIEAIAVVAIVFSVDFALGLYLDKYHALGSCKVARIAANNNVDIAMMGASEMQNQYNTPLIADSLGMTAYNYGNGGMNIYFQYAMLNLMINNAPVNPKVVIMETQSIDFYETPEHSTNVIAELNSLYNYDDSVKSVLNLQQKNEPYLLRYLQLYKYNTKLMISVINPLYVKLYKNHREPEMGYVYIDESKVITQPIQENTTDTSYVFDSQKEQYLRRFIALCKQNDIKLIFINAPYYEISSRIQWEEKLTKICEEEDIPFLNYNHNELFQQHPDWYYNPVHFNRIGSDYYSKMIIKDLRREIEGE